MKLFSIIVGVLVAVAALVYTLNLTLAPKELMIIKPSEFSQAQDLGTFVYRQLREKLTDFPVAVWLHQEDHLEFQRVLSGFYQMAKDDQRPVQMILVQPGITLVKELESLPVVRLSQEKSEIEGQIKDSMTKLSAAQSNSPLQMIFILEKDFYQEIKDLLPGHAAIFHQEKMIVNSADYQKLNTDCRLEESQEGHRLNTACAAIRKSHFAMKKHLNTQKNIGALDQIGLNEFLIYLHSPAPNF